MADGFVTQSRHAAGLVESLSAFGQTAFALPFTGGPLTGYFGDLCRQVTYSYRTGNQYDPGVDEDELADEPSTVAGEFAFLVKDKESQGDLHPGDTGHVFETVKTVAAGCGIPAAFVEPPSRPSTIYQGPLFPIAGTESEVTPDKITDPLWYGTRAIAETIPTKPNSTLADALGQVLEHSFFPNADVFKRGLYLLDSNPTMRKVPQEWLNYEFGWLPFKDDVEDFVKTAVESRKIIKQFMRDSSQDVRRVYRFSPSESSKFSQTNTQFAGGKPPLFPGHAANAVSDIFGLHAYPVQMQWVQTMNVWFKGCYTYKLPMENTIMSKLDQAERLFGVELTPADVWDLAPWSWLADWKTSIGDIIKNASYLAGDSTVLKYGYLMFEQERETTYSIAASEWLAPSTGVHGGGGSASITFLSKRKQRFRATPYGFGIDPLSFSLQQWSILGALGLTKAWKTLW